jgi:hypothetical protein
MKTWEDETKSTGEKIVSTLTSISTSGVSAAIGIASVLKTFTSLGGGKLALAVGVIMAAVAAITLVVKGIDAAFETTEERVEALREK